MANTQEYITVIRLNDNEAKNKLADLKKKVEDIRKERDKAIAAGADTSFVRQLSKDLKSAEAEVKAYNTNVTKTIEVMKNLSSATLEDVKKTMRALKVEQAKTTDPKDYARLEEHINACRERMNQFANAVKLSGDEAKKMMEKLDSLSIEELSKLQGHLTEKLSGSNPNSNEYLQTAEQLKTVKDRIGEISDGQKTVNKLVEQYNKDLKAADNEMKAVSSSTELVERTMNNLSGASLRDLQTTLKVLNESLKDTDRGTEAYDNLKVKLKKVKDAIKEVNEEVEESSSIWDKTIGALNRNWGAIMQIMGSLSGLQSVVKQCIDAYSEMEEAMADVRKYTGQTEEQVHEMNEDFKKMDTRSSREQLNELAGAAGRLGKTSKKDIEEFVDAADKINVALGDDLGKGAVDKIGKLAIAFGEDDRLGLRGAMLATGSAINELAQNSSANAGYLVEFTARVAGVAKTLGMSQADIMGYGAVLDETMQKDEMAATAFSQLLSNMASDTKKFAKLAGMDAKEFADLVKNDVNGAVLALMKNIKSKGGFETMSKMFGDMGMDGSRALSVLTTMADKIGNIEDRQKLANEAYEEAQSVIEEFNVQNNTVQAGLDKAKKAFNDISVELGEKLMPLASTCINTGSLAVRTLAELVGYTTEHWKVMVTLAAGIATYTVAANASLVVDKLAAAWTATKTAASAAYHVVLDVVTAKTLRATAAQEGWNKAILKNPYVLAIAMIAALGTALYALTKKTNENAEAQKSLDRIRKRGLEGIEEQKRAVENLRDIARDETVSIEKREKAVKALNNIIPDYNAKIDETTGKYIESKKALDNYLVSLQKKYELEGAKDELAALGKEKAQAKIEKQKAQADLSKGQQRKATLQNESKESPLTAAYSHQTVGYGKESAADIVIDRAQSKLDKVNSTLKDIERREKAITDVYGKDLQDETLQKVSSGDESSGNSGNGGYKSESDAKKEKAAAAKAERERKAAIKAAIEKQKAVTAAENAENMRSYSVGEKSYREFLRRKHEIALEDLDAQIKIYGDNSNEAEKLREKKEQLLMAYEKDQQDSEKNILRNTKRCAIDLQLAYEDKNSELYHNDRALQEALYMNEMDGLMARQELYKKGSQEWLDIQAEIEDKEEQHMLDKKQEYADLLADYREKWARRDIEEEKSITQKGLEELHEKGLLSEEEYQQMKKSIRLKYAQDESEDNLYNSEVTTTSRNASAAYSTAKNNAEAGSAGPSMGSMLIGDITQYQSVVEQLRTMYEQDAINYEEFQQAKKQATDDLVEGIASKMQAAYDSVNQIVSAAASYYSAQSQYETAVTTKKYDKMISAAGKNQKKQKKLEEQKQKELAKIKNKYNKKQQKIEIAQAIASTALAAINSYASASKVNWILGAVAAAMATAAGAIQIATIQKQHAAEEAGYYSGGFTGGSNYRRQAGVVHEGEFVANHQAVNNSNILPALQLIDQAQKNNTVGALTADDVSRSLGTGSTVVSAPVVNVSTDNSGINAAMEETKMAVSNLNSILANGITSVVVMDGDNGLDEQWKRYNRLKKNV